MTSFIVRPNSLVEDFPKTAASQKALNKAQQDYIDSLRVGSNSDNLDWNQMIKTIRETVPNCWIDGNCPEITAPIIIPIFMRYYKNPRGATSIVVTFKEE